MENKKICRLCTRKGIICFDVLQENKMELLKIIKKLFNIHLTNQDDFHHICSRCHKKLIGVSNYCKEIEEAQRVFNIQFCEMKPDTEELDSIVTIKDEVIHDVASSAETELKPFETSNSFHFASVIERDVPTENVLLDVNQDHDVNSGVEENHATKNANRLQKELHRDKAVNEFYDFTCRHCPFTANHWKSYKKHLIQSHREDPLKFNCCNVEIPLERRYLLAHIEYHTHPEKLKCEICSKQFMSLESKRKHERQHDASRSLNKCRTKEDRYACTECGKVLAHRNSIIMHMKLHMPEEEREKLKVQCDLCKKFFQNKNSVLGHIQDMHIPKEKPVSCDQCAREFTSYRTFLTHYRVNHTYIGKVTCADCGAQIKATNLKKHQRLKHDNQSKTCPICSKVCKNREFLLIHNRRTHVEPRFSCDVCGKMFRINNLLKEHREAHFRTNRFSCDQCNYVNNDYPNMIKHRKAKHPNAPPGCSRKIFEIR